MGAELRPTLITREQLSAVCGIPTIARKSWRSWRGIITRTSYPAIRHEINPAMLAAFLAQHPECVAEWESYSLDKRTSGGWYLIAESDKWRVGALRINYPNDDFVSKSE